MVFHQDDDRWIELSDIGWEPTSKHLWLISDKSGFQHLYTVVPDGTVSPHGRARTPDWRSPVRTMQPTALRTVLAAAVPVGLVLSATVVWQSTSAAFTSAPQTREEAWRPIEIAAPQRFNARWTMYPPASR